MLTGFGLYGWSLTFSSLGPGSGTIKAEGHCLLGCINQLEKEGFGLVTLHIKGLLQAKSLAISKNWLAQEE